MADAAATAPELHAWLSGSSAERVEKLGDVLNEQH
jgi:hypothetical protein